MLARARPASMGEMAAIPLTEIEAMARMVNLRQMMPLHEFVSYVQFLDDVFREWYRKHRKKGA